MKISNIGCIFRKEVQETLRDRRTIFTMIIIPLLLYPGLLLFVNSLASRQQAKMEQKTVRVALVQIPEDSVLARMLRAEKKIEIVTSRNPFEDVQSGALDFAIQAPSNYLELLQQQKTIQIDVLLDRSNDEAATNVERVRGIVNQFARDLLNQRLNEKSLSREFIEPLSVKEVNVATKRRMGGFVISRFLPMLMVFMILVGAFYPSIDMTAGEKERGTLETILTSPASKSEIVIGKFLTVSLIALFTGLLNLGSMMATFAYGIFASVSEAIQINIPFSYMLIMVGCMIPLAIFFGGIMMAIASFARSFKEAQNLVTPFYLVATIPAMVSSIPGIRLEGFWLTLPIANVVLLFKELMLGILSWPHIFAVFFSMTFLASVAVFGAVRLFGREEVLFGGASTFGLSFKRSNIIAKSIPVPSESLFFSMVSLALLIYVAVPMQARDLISGLIFTEVALFLCFPIAFAVYMKLDLRQTFRLKNPSARSLSITLLLFFAIVCSMGTIVYLQDKMFPFPKELMDFLQKFTEQIYQRPFWQALLLIAIMPAVCEETTFRGIILSGLLGNKKPLVAIAITSLLFGVFHLSLHRFPGVFLIGMAAGYVVWISGSILPGILLHALSNGFVSFVAVYPQYDFVGIQQMQPSWLVIPGVGFVALAVWWGLSAKSAREPE